MIRISLAVFASAFAVLLSSCGCCTSDVSAPPLRPMPQFREIPTTPGSVQVEYSK